MAKRRRPKSFDEYLAKFRPPAHPILRRVRATLRKALPGSTEILDYDLPGFHLWRHSCVSFAGWNRHYALYPITDFVKAKLGRALEPFEVDKATIRFSWAEPVPTTIITRIAKARAIELRAQIDRGDFDPDPD